MPRPTPVLIALAVVALLAPATASAQDPPPARRDRPARRERLERLADRPEELRETVALFFFHRVRTELGLSDEQAVRILPLIEKMEAARRESGRRRHEISLALERLAGDPAAPEAEVNAAVAGLDREDRRSREEQDALRDQLLAALSPQQRARFVLFAHEFRRRIEEKLRGLPDRLPGKPPGGPPGEPGPR